MVSQFLTPPWSVRPPVSAPQYLGRVRIDGTSAGTITVSVFTRHPLALPTSRPSPTSGAAS